MRGRQSEPFAWAKHGNGNDKGKGNGKTRSKRRQFCGNSFPALPCPKLSAAVRDRPSSPNEPECSAETKPETSHNARKLRLRLGKHAMHQKTKSRPGRKTRLNRDLLLREKSGRIVERRERVCKSGELRDGHALRLCLGKPDAPEVVGVAVAVAAEIG